MAETPRQELGREEPRNSPLTPARVGAAPEQEPGPVGQSQPPRRAAAQQPRASREHVPGRAAALRGPWQAAENKTAARSLWLLPRARLPAPRMPARLSGAGAPARLQRCLPSACSAQGHPRPAPSAGDPGQARAGTGSAWCSDEKEATFNNLPRECFALAFPPSAPI